MLELVEMAAIGDHEVDGFQPRQRFTQRPHGNQGAVADTTGRIEDGKFNIPGKPIMLEPVVAHQNGTQPLLQCP